MRTTPPEMTQELPYFEQESAPTAPAFTRIDEKWLHSDGRTVTNAELPTLAAFIFQESFK